MSKKTVNHKEILVKISKILPRIEAWTDFGSEMELILHAEEAFHIEDNSATTVALDARIVPHTIQLPVVKRRKKREK